MISVAEQIFVEKKFKELFATLPDVEWTNPVTALVESFTPIFEIGNEKDFNQFIKEENVFRPIIWLDSEFEESFMRDGIETSVSFVLPILNDDSAMFNEERLDLSFVNILRPLLENMLKAINRSNTMSILDDSVKVTKFYNYGIREARSNKEKQYVSVPVDAYRVEIDLKVFNYCLKTINYG